MRDRITKEKPALILGNNMDRKEIASVQERIYRDFDVKKLIYIGRGRLIRNLFIFVVSIVVFTNGVLVDNPFELPEILTPFSLFLFIYGAIGTIKEFPSFLAKSMNIWSQIKYRFSHTSPRHPADLWSFLQGSLADIQMYNVTKGLLDTNELNVQYAGRPYYDLYYIDSVSIRWIPMESQSLVEKLESFYREKKQYQEFYERFSRRTFLAKADNKYFKNNNKVLERSNSVFGLLFSSEYFYDTLICQNNSTFAGVEIKLKTEEKDNEKRELLAKEWMKYCLIPDVIDVSKEEKGRYTICVTDIQCGINSSKWGIWNEIKSWFSRDIRIPVKRFIAMESNPLVVGGEYISIGGAEQNLALQSLINRYRWDGYENFEINKQAVFKQKSKLRIGFAENRFECERKQDFLAGTEGLVYGIKDVVIGRLNKQNENNYKAECFVMKFDDGTKVFSIYGFSAMATKIALAKSIEARNDNSETGSQFIPGECIQTVDILELELINADSPTMKIFSSSEGKYFDENDLMNDVKHLNSWLKGELPETEGERCHIRVVTRSN